MNVPARALRSFQMLQHKVEYSSIVNFVRDRFKKLKKLQYRAKFIHELVDEHNKEIFDHPLVKELSPCKIGCVGCCYTQVSVTKAEAELLVSKITDGMDVNLQRLILQASVGNNSQSYSKIPYADRRCIFLSEENSCLSFN